MNSNESYLYGLLIADGSLYLSHDKSRKVDNRGRVSLEVNTRDKDIVVKLFNLIPNSHIRERTRATNFKENYSTCSFVNSQKAFRDWLIGCGYPLSDKTHLASPPSVEYCEIDFWRGFIDGDGSIGFDKRGVPFISIVTVSESMKEAYLAFLQSRYGITKIANRNKRDNAYNIVVYSEKAVNLAKDLWNNPELSLDRKAKKADLVKQWVRPATMPRRERK